MKTTINTNKSIIPPFLQKGDSVEIVAPAKFISKSEVDVSVKILESWGLSVKLKSEVFNKHNVFSGTILERKTLLQEALDDINTRAVFFARGGYGTIHVLDQVDFTTFKKHPKWLIGFSDITILLSHIQCLYNIASIHGPMIYNFSNTDSNNIVSLFELLSGDKVIITAPTFFKNRLGVTTGKLIGGNLSILCSLLGSESLRFEGADFILFIEDVDEYLYHIERMFYTLDRAGLLKNIKGLIIGEMTELKDNDDSFGKTFEEIIFDIVKKYNYPVCFNFPIGHGSQNHPVIIGADITLEVKSDFVKMNYL